jgi:hypothetical protein
MRRCQWCKDGIPLVDGAGKPYVLCALIPPTAVPVQSVVTRPSAEGGTGAPELVTTIRWERPPMALGGWCGQFKMSVRKLLFSRGART